jgi:hypothetical protein
MNIEDYFSWASGNLVDNRNRGIFGEWIVGKALEIILPGEYREEWASFDLLYKNSKIEIKTSGFSQVWNPNNRTVPRFDIAGQKWTWLGSLDNFDPPDGWKGQARRDGFWEEHTHPKRTADLYVFCLHDPTEYENFVPATTANVADMNCWKFWVISTCVLNLKVGNQKSVGLSGLNRITTPVRYSELKSKVDKELSENK